ncbi:unnamed protein product [Mytilus edulis]|uniref:Macro domain-containing protein n=1 Tax=Mytilus edulis TaxID=6550 RepID=A0A8S3TGR4_MYTED|nr:unnamed protein product [Mytilus edulis]
MTEYEDDEGYQMPLASGGGDERKDFEKQKKFTETTRSEHIYSEMYEEDLPPLPTTPRPSVKRSEVADEYKEKINMDKGKIILLKIRGFSKECAACQIDLNSDKDEIIFIGSQDVVMAAKLHMYECLEESVEETKYVSKGFAAILKENSSWIKGYIKERENSCLLYFKDDNLLCHKHFQTFGRERDKDNHGKLRKEKHKCGIEVERKKDSTHDLHPVKSLPVVHGAEKPDLQRRNTTPDFGGARPKQPQQDGHSNFSSYRIDQLEIILKEGNIVHERSGVLVNVVAAGHDNFNKSRITQAFMRKCGPEFEQILYKAIRDCLRQCSIRNHDCVAFSAVGTGQLLKYPVHEVVNCLVSEAKVTAQRSKCITKIKFVIFDSATVGAFKEKLDRLSESVIYDHHRHDSSPSDSKEDLIGPYNDSSGKPLSNNGYLTILVSSAADEIDNVYQSQKKQKLNFGDLVDEHEEINNS